MDGPETSDDKEKYEVTSQTTSEEILSKDKNDQQKSNTTKKGTSYVNNCLLSHLSLSYETSIIRKTKKDFINFTN